MSDPILFVQGITKRFGSVLAHDRVDAQFFPGEIHAVLGENGAGKSTLMGVLAGFVRPDHGTVSLRGDADFPFDRPFRVKGLGIEMVHQHFMLVPEFSVAENLALYRIETLLAAGNERARAEPALAKGRELGWVIDPEARTGDLPVGVQQRVEILKCLSGDAPILILDEPTAVLSPDEVEDLFRVLRQLKAEGKTIILIAHKLSEVMAIADRATVLRRGKWAASTLISQTDRDQLARWMVGELPLPTARPSRTHGGVCVRVENGTVAGDRGELAVRGVSFEIRAGEIAGFGGVDGNGQVELAEALAGIRPAQGMDTLPESIAYIPQDRQTDGLALSLSILENMMISGHRREAFKKGPFLRLSAITAWAEEQVRRYQIKIGRLDDPVRSLSGGNQQKVVVSRNLDQVPELIVAVNPTRGLDLRATAFVHESLRQAADAGAAVALFSADLDELAAVADRSQYLSRGTLSEEFVSA